jgi:hypothetical protein
MKKQTLTIAAALFFTALLPGQGRAQTTTRANVPFAFQAGNEEMPGGEYEIQRAPTGTGSALQLRRIDSSASAFVLTNPADPANKSGEAKLIFNCYHHECFLSQIWNGNGQGRKPLESRREKELARATVENELAMIASADSQAVRIEGGRTLHRRGFDNWRKRTYTTTQTQMGDQGSRLGLPFVCVPPDAHLANARY